MVMTMLSNVEFLSVLVGVIVGFFLLAAFGWSIAFPQRRIWLQNMPQMVSNFGSGSPRYQYLARRLC